MKRIIAALLCIMLSLSLSACGGSSTSGSSSTAPAASAAGQEETKAAAASEKNEEISAGELDFSAEEGSVKYVRFEKANPKLTDYDNALIFVFEYTNKKDTPSMVHEDFWIEFFQNGTELSDSATYSSEGGDQYDLVNAFFDSALKGGTVTFAQIVVPKDNSPVTIMVKKQGSSDEYQMSEIDIAASSGSAAKETQEQEAAAGATAEEIDEALRGIWEIEDGQFIFNKGEISVVKGSAAIGGSYEINMEESQIVAVMEATDGKVSFSIPYEYSDGNLKVWNNNGAEMEKKY